MTTSLQLIDIDTLATILGRSARTIQSDVSRNPGAVPPRVIIPGSRLLKWRVSDVEQWLDSLVERIEPTRPEIKMPAAVQLTRRRGRPLKSQSKKH